MPASFVPKTHSFHFLSKKIKMNSKLFDSMSVSNGQILGARLGDPSALSFTLLYVATAHLRGERTLPTLSPSYSAQGRAGSQQIIARWQPFKDLQQLFAVSRCAEQLRLHTQQHLVATVEDSALRVEMGALESQEEDAPRRIWYKPFRVSWGDQAASPG